MKNILVTLLIFVLINACASKEETYEDTIKKHQYELNVFYANEDTSPLTEEDVKTFNSHDFFEINKKFCVMADLMLTPNEPIFEMQTTTDRLPLYKKYGIATFTIDGEMFQVSLYRNQEYLNSPEHGNQLFLPFNDLTNGNESYGGGRYIDLEIPPIDSKTIEIDFNKSYNPYCAYNSKYSCPIPPSENMLQIKILAGVKAFSKHH